MPVESRRRDWSCLVQEALRAFVGLLARVSAGVAAALVLAGLFALVWGGAFLAGFRAAILVAGGALLLMTAGGSSPARRTGIKDPLLATFVPKLYDASKLPAPSAASNDRINPNALFFLSGLVLLAIAVTMPV